MSDARVQLDSWTANRDAALDVANAAERRLALLSWDLDPPVYSTEEFASAVRRIATASRYAQVRIVVQDSRRAVADGHKLIELARRLSSFVSIRNPHPEHRNVIESFLVADEQALLWRKQTDRYDGFADLDDPYEARQKLKLFDEIWNRALPDPEMRRLGI
jgi:hypothetical protein